MDPVGVSLDSVISDFLADCARRNLSPRTSECYRDVLSDFAGRQAPGADLAALDLASARRYLEREATDSGALRQILVISS